MGLFFISIFCSADYSMFLWTYSPHFPMLLCVLCSRVWLCRINQMPSGLLLGLASNSPSSKAEAEKRGVGILLPWLPFPLLWVGIWLCTLMRGHDGSFSFSLPPPWIPANTLSSCPLRPVSRTASYCSYFSVLHVLDGFPLTLWTSL